MLKRVSAVFLLFVVLIISTGRVFADQTVSGAVSGGSGLSNSPSLILSPTSPTTIPPLILPPGSNNQTVTRAASGAAPSSDSSLPPGVTGANTIDTACSGGGLGRYIGLVAGGLGEFISVDTVSGFIQKWTGLGEGISQINDLLVRHFTRAVIWGIFATAVIWILGPIFNFVLYLNTTIINTSVVKEIFGVLLNLVNVGFVLAIIVIAFATMFRNNKYGGSKNLTKVIVAALLINFGFFFAKVVIDAGNAATYVFADAVSGTTYTPGSTIIPDNFGSEATLSSRYNVASITCGVSSLLSTFSQNINQSGNVSGVTKIITNAFVFLSQPLVSITIGAVISLVWAATLIAIIMVFLVRYAFLVFLVAIMPISWLGLIFPSLKISIPGIKGSDPFSGWWSQFINWVIIGPMLLFLLYISHLLSDALTSSSKTINFVQNGTAATGLSALVIQLAAILIVNLIGLYGAVKMSGAAGAIAMTAAGGAIGWAAQGLTNFSGAAAARLHLRSEAWQKASQENKSKLGAFGQGVAARALGTTSRTLSGVALPPQYRTILEKAGVKIPQTKEFDAAKSIENRKKQLESRLPDEVLAMARAGVNARNIPLARNAVDSAAILSYLIDKRQLGNLDNKHLVPLLKSAASIGAQKDTLAVRPDLVALIEGKKSGIDPKSDVEKNTDNILKGYMGSISKAVDKIKPGQAENLSTQSLARPKDENFEMGADILPFEAVTLALSNSQVARILREGSSEQQKTLIENIKMLNGDRGDALIKKYEAYPKVTEEIDRQRKRLAEYVGGVGEEEEGEEPQQEGKPTIYGPRGEVLSRERSPQQPGRGGKRRGRGGGNPDFRALWNSIKEPKATKKNS